MSHRQILVPKLTTFSNFWPCGSKKLIFGENEALIIPSSLSKNGNRNRSLPEVTAVWLDRKWKKFWWVFGPTEFNSLTFYFKVYLPSLRSASVLTLVPGPRSTSASFESTHDTFQRCRKTCKSIHGEMHGYHCFISNAPFLCCFPGFVVRGLILNQNFNGCNHWSMVASCSNLEVLN